MPLVNYLVVGGGAGGASDNQWGTGGYAGGGGASSAGVATLDPTQTYTITVGSGGAGAGSGGGGGSGNASSAFGTTANGGISGPGVSTNNRRAGLGGSGNGESYNSGTQYSNSGINGGPGFVWTVNSTTYGGGGGGRAVDGTTGTGGLGGGGGFQATGTDGLGGGGGAGGGEGGHGGGSGVVIVRYSGTPQWTGGTITQSGGFTTHTFTSSGSLATQYVAPAYLGYDYSGNQNHWTPNNFYVSSLPTFDSDWLVDVTTNTSPLIANFATMNPNYASLSQPTFSDGNLTVTANAFAYQNSFATFNVANAKWYWEIQVNGTPGVNTLIGISNAAELTYLQSNARFIGYEGGYGWLQNGSVIHNQVVSNYGTGFNQGDTIMVALDLAGNRLYLGTNGTWQNSANPATGTGGFTIVNDTYYPGLTLYTPGFAYQINFGQQTFRYTAPTGFNVINLFNDPTG